MNKKLKVLVACEYSGTVRDAFAELGHDAWSCDILPSESEGNHIQGDVIEQLDKGWDLMVAHPPCTHLAVSGARWFTEGVKPWSLQEDALDFVRKLLNAPIKRIAIENPISVISTKIRKPNQIIQPWMFGDLATKTTCLWTKGLPNLIPSVTKKPELEYHYTKSGRRMQKWMYDIRCKTTKNGLRQKLASKTFKGIADAMANQWSKI